MFRRPTKRFSLLVSVAITTVMIGAGGGAATYAALSSGTTRTIVRQVTVADSQPAASTSTLSVNEIYRRAHEGVVELTVSSRSGSVPFGATERQQAQGSGFVYDTSGDVVTNQHVVDDATSISVKFWNGATYSAKVVGADASTDLAVLKVGAPASLLRPLTLGDSSRLAVGDGVVAIGSPFGLDETVTSGIVSALHRQMSSPNGFPIDDSIQTDAAINHGNSGGPLLDTQGKVIGVNAQIESDSGGNDGVGFAIPSATVRSIVAQLVASGKVEHAFLGVVVETIPASAAGSLGLVPGAEVTSVRSGTPAARARLHAATGSRVVDNARFATGGDVITAIDGDRISSVDALRRAIDAKRPGATISLTYSRAGRSHTAKVKLASRPS